jgi:hypothetical protein
MLAVSIFLNVDKPHYVDEPHYVNEQHNVARNIWPNHICDNRNFLFYKIR